MTDSSKKDFWINMSIREIQTQAHFAKIAYENIKPKSLKYSDNTFSSIHSFLTHCALISKLLAAKYKDENKHFIGKTLGVSDNSIIHNRGFRNDLDHYDERLMSWVDKTGPKANVVDYNVMPINSINVPNLTYIRNYDPSTNIYTFMNEPFDIGSLYGEAEKIESMADNWLKNN